MKIVFLGLTLTSSWGNGHATTFRSLCRALHARGHSIVFVEKDVEWYRNNRDLPEPEYCRLILYSSWQELLPALLQEIHDADVVVLGSYFPDGKAAADFLADKAQCPVLFYDIDTPITLATLREEGATEYLNARQIPRFAAYLSFTGGPVLQELETRFGARRAVPFYCSVDPDRHYPQPTGTPRYHLSYLGTYSSDRQPKLEGFLCTPAAMLPEQQFIVAGSLYPEALQWPSNVERITHIAPPEHPAFYSASRFTLNLTRQEMVRMGYSPSVRLFEAAACGTAILSDAWHGLDTFFTPGSEILLPASAEEVAGILLNTSTQEIARIGEAARARVLAQHTSSHRAQELEEVIQQCYGAASSSRSSKPEPAWMEPSCASSK